MKDKFKSLHQKYRSMKDGINTETGKLVERIFYYVVIITTFLLIPILFTTMSTLMGAGTISSGAYYGIFYTVWVILFLSFFIWRFFREYKFKN